MAMYLPPNTTSLVQPMDQGVLVTVKRHYKRALLHKLLLVDNNGHSMVSFVKTIDMKDVVYFSAASWEQISSLTLSRSWLKLLGSHSITSENPEEHSHESAESALPPEQSDEASCEELLQLLDKYLTDQDVQNWAQADSNDPGHQLYTDNEIISQVLGSEPSSEEETDEQEEVLKLPSSAQVADMVDQCLTWYEHQPEATATSLMILKGVKDLAVKKRCPKFRQMTLKS